MDVIFVCLLLSAQIVVLTFLVYGFLFACFVVGALSFIMVAPLEEMVLTPVLAAVVPPVVLLVAPLVAIICNWLSLVGMVESEVLVEEDGVIGEFEAGGGGWRDPRGVLWSTPPLNPPCSPLHVPVAWFGGRAVWSLVGTGRSGILDKYGRFDLNLNLFG